MAGGGRVTEWVREGEGEESSGGRGGRVGGGGWDGVGGEGKGKA